MGRIDKRALELYLITDRTLAGKRPLETIVEEAVLGGVTMVQLREKDCKKEEFIRLGRSMKSLLNKYNVPLIINDDVEVALACDADGVHLGQSDMSAAQARQILGPEKIIGLSVENFDQVQQAEMLDVDYIAASPVYRTKTKKDTKTAFRPEGVEKIVRMSSHPVIGIGRMNTDTAPEVIRRGADGVAVVSAIISARNPRMAAQTIAQAVRKARENRSDKSADRIRWSILAEFCTKNILRRIRKSRLFLEMNSGKLKYQVFHSFMLQNEWMFRQYFQMLRYIEVRIESSESEQAAYGSIMSLIHYLNDNMEPDTSRMHSFYLGDSPRIHEDSIFKATRDFIDFVKSESRDSTISIAMSALYAYPHIASLLAGHLVSNSNNESNRYISWINLYSSPEFLHDMQRFTKVMDALAQDSSLRQKIQMLKVYRKCSKLILSIWNSLK
ncbi:MAG: thiamine phosphate synthase [Alistipes sp.]|nr:thiamine phosphate synthase [Candidatus Minthomonas equi]